MLLKFLAKPMQMQPWPDSHNYGQPRRYIGWQWLAADPAKNLPVRYEPKRDGDVVDTDVIAAPHVEQITRLCAKGAYLAGDEATAVACGVPFVRADFSEAGFVVAKAATEAPKKISKE